jgi:hypothetical protein
MWSKPALAFAIAFFIAASTAAGVFSQSGIVKTAFAFAAAARKSSTVFISAAETARLEASRMSGTSTSAALMESFDIGVEAQNRPKIYTEFHQSQTEI